MSKAIITYEFDLNDPDDKREFEIIQSAKGYEIVIAHLSEELRQFFKYDAADIFEMKQPVSEECYSLAENIRARLYAICNEQGVRIL